MFGKKKEILALQQQVKELSERLCAEQDAHALDLNELRSYRDKRELERRSYLEMQQSCQQKLQDLDAQMELFKKQRALVIEKLREEKTKQDILIKENAIRAKETLRQELQDEREQTHEGLNARISEFSDVYGYYLSQIKLMMDLLTQAALHTSDRFLTAENVDTEQLFRDEVAAGLDQTSFEALCRKQAAERDGGVRADAAGDALAAKDGDAPEADAAGDAPEAERAEDSAADAAKEEAAEART